MNDPIRVACVGAGYFSQFHIASWRRMNEVALVAVADHDIVLAEATGLPSFSDVSEMIEETRPDLLDIIVPPPGHADIIRIALAAGLRTIICQKPFCMSLEEAQSVVAKAQAAGALLVVHENFRFMPWYRFIQTALAAGAVGKLHQVTFRLRPGDGQGPDAYLDRQPYFQDMPRFLVHETAVHWIDVFRFVLGEPRSVYADLRQLNPAIKGEDAGYILFEYEDGVRALFDGNRHLDHASDNTRRTMGEALFEGTEATLQLFGDGRVERRAFGADTPQVVFPADTWEGFGGDCVHALQTHVLNALRLGTPVENEARSYCDVLRIRDAVYASAETGRRVPL